jgi:hypothetical protein
MCATRVFDGMRGDDELVGDLDVRPPAPAIAAYVPRGAAQQLGLRADDRGMRLVAAALFAALAVSSQAFAATTPAELRKAPVRNQSVLFAHDADRGTFTAIPGRRGQYWLRLEGVSPRAIFFENRPGLNSGEVSVTRMLAGFFDKPGVDVPNAAVNVIAPDGRQRLMAVKLLSASYDRQRATVRYRVRALRNVTTPLPPSRRSTDARLPGSFGDASVFIDTFWNRCTSGITNSTAENMNYAGSTIGSHDSWGNDYLQGANRPALQTIVPAQPGSAWSTDFWGDTSGFARGCSVEVRYSLAQSGAIVTVSVASPYTGSNEYSCTVSDPRYTCTLNTSSQWTPSSFSGADVAAFYTVRLAQ